MTDRELKTPAKTEILEVMETMKGNLLIVFYVYFLIKKKKNFKNWKDVHFICGYRCRGISWQRWILWKCFQSHSTTMFQQRRCRCVFLLQLNIFNCCLFSYLKIWVQKVLSYIVFQIFCRFSCGCYGLLDVKAMKIDQQKTRPAIILYKRVSY